MSMEVESHDVRDSAKHAKGQVGWGGGVDFNLLKDLILMYD